MAQELLSNKNLVHGKIRIGFTPDEEVGCGVDFFDVEGFGADYAYTVDGGDLGELEYENFNAAGAKLIIDGHSVHPGSAKIKCSTRFCWHRSFKTFCRYTKTRLQQMAMKVSTIRIPSQEALITL